MSRRVANGLGSVRQRLDGRWEAKYTLPNGARRSVYGRTQQDVIKKMKDAQEESKGGNKPTPERLTVKQWLGEWGAALDYKVRPRTAQRYKEIVDLHLIPRIGHLRLRRLTAADVERLVIRDGLKAGQSPQSVAHHRAVLRTALTAYLKNGQLPNGNVAAKADAPHIEQKEQDPLTPAKAQAIIGAVRGDRLGGALSVAVGDGSARGRGAGPEVVRPEPGRRYAGRATHSAAH